MKLDLAKYVDYDKLLLRLVLVFIFLWHGVPKAIDWPMAAGKFSAMGFPGFLGPIVGIVEVIGAILILIGVWHKWANLVLAIIILVAILGVQLPKGVTAGLERDLMILAGTLLLASCGPGRLAIQKEA